MSATTTTSVSGRRAEKVTANRSAVLAAARAVFGREGYSRASLDKIAAEAGFTKGVVYSQFQSKADLFLCLLEEQVATRAAGLLTGDPSDLAGNLRASFTESFADPSWRLALLEFRVVAARDEELNVRYRAVHDRTAAGIAAAIQASLDAAGHPASLPPDALARVSLAIEAGSFLEAVATEGAFGVDEAVDAMLRILGVTGGAS
jgi:AcrR family transcriptional regulator